MSGLQRQPDGSYVTATKECSFCGEQYIVEEEHRTRSPRHLRWQKGELDPEIPVPPQGDSFKYPEGGRPARIAFGETARCPRCKGNTRPSRQDSLTGRRTPAETFSRDPSHSKERCIRCNGEGVIPNHNV